MTKIVTLIGDLGGGKTSLGGALAALVRFLYPTVPLISNVTIPWARKVPDIHKFLAIKLMKEDKRYAFLLDDEAAQAGLESRGSGSKAAAIESRIITLARKAHVDLILVSQLKSMLDKRAQWLENNSILCEAGFDPENLTATPDFFHYTIYNSKLEEINWFDIPTSWYWENVWPWMDTDDIPFKSALDAQFRAYYNIKESDMRQFEWIMQASPLQFDRPEEEKKAVTPYYAKKYLRIGETVLLDGKDYDVMNRTYDARRLEYRYLLSEAE